MAPPAPVTATPGEDTMMIVARHRSGLMSRLFHSWAVPWRFWPFDASKLLARARRAVLRRARHLRPLLRAARHAGGSGPHVRDAAGYQTMWRDFLACIEDGRRPELTLEQVFADFAYMDAAYRSRTSGRPETPAAPPS